MSDFIQKTTQEMLHGAQQIPRGLSCTGIRPQKLNKLDHLRALTEEILGQSAALEKIVQDKVFRIVGEPRDSIQEQRPAPASTSDSLAGQSCANLERARLHFQSIRNLLDEL